ncbi:hypothetical protein J4219_02825 [Candidatus Woesearchaeota archaeon]|nr:hypothetical protein [Candidatus Woesearchaeota archaeon]
MALREKSGWSGLNKPNASKLIILLIVITLNFISFLYVLSNALCVAAPSCFEPSALNDILAPIVTSTYYPFYIQNELADSIVYERIYTNETTHIIKRKYPVPVEYGIRGVFILLALSFYLTVAYLFSCTLHESYKKIKSCFFKE